MLGKGKGGPAFCSFSSSGSACPTALVGSPLGIKGPPWWAKVLSSPCNVPDMVVKKLAGTIRARIRPVSFKGWEVGRVFSSLNLVFGFFPRSGFLMVCLGTPF